MLKKVFIVYLIFVQLNCSYSQFDFETAPAVGITKPNVIVTPTSAPATYNQDNINQVISVVKDVEDKQNFINLGDLSPDSNVALPAGIIKDIGAVRYVIAIDSIKFKPQGAYFSAYAAISFPGTLKKLAFKGSNIKFNPAGVVGGEQARLYLASSHVIQINPTVKLRLLDNGQNWVEWNCDGFKAINLVGNFEFSKNRILPDSTSKSDTIVRASFQIYTENIHNFIAAVNISPFKLAGLPGWGFKVTNAIVDMSELSNAPGMSFPPGYNNPNLNPEPNLPEQEYLQNSNVTDMGNVSNGNISNTPNSNFSGNQMQYELWRGFYLKELKVKLPPEISKTGQRTEVNANNLLIDNMGISGMFIVKPLFEIGEGNMSGWGFSIDRLKANFVTNNLTGGQLMGRVKVPVDEINSLSYSATMNKNFNSGKVDYHFVVNPTNNMSFDVFGADVNLNSNSYMSVESDANNKFKPTLVLNGFIGFKTPKFNSKEGRLGFQNLTVVTYAPYITDGVFSLSLTNGARLSMKHFSLTLNDLNLGVNQGKPVLSASVGVNVSGSESFDISLGTNIYLRGKLVPSSNPAFSKLGRLVLDDVNVNGFAIDVKVAPFKLQGMINFVENNPMYGDGIFGAVNFVLPNVIDFPVGASLGFGNTGVFKYYYVDVKVPGPIPIGSSPFIITNVIGGLYYHLQPNKTTTADFINLTSSFGNITNAPLNYVPNASIPLGVKVGASLVTTTGEFKATALLDLAFNNNAGLNNVNLSGNATAVGGSIPINGNMMMNYNVPTKTFDGLFAISATYYGVINGNGLLKIHSDPNNWHVCAGTPQQPMVVTFMNFANVNGYFMTGTNLPIPSYNKIPIGRSGVELSQGRATCLGSWLTANLGSNSFGWDFFTVTPNFNFDLGFDGMLRNYGNNATCSNNGQPFGINGRYFKANAYLKMNGSLKINGHLKIPGNCPSTSELHPCGPKHCCCVITTIDCVVNRSFDFTIFSAPNIELYLETKLPKPLYFAGTLSKPYNIFNVKEGTVNFNFNYGTNCNTPN